MSASSSADRGRLHARHLRLVAGVSLIMIAAPVAAVTFTFVNPAVAQDFGVGLSEVMIGFSIMTLTNAFSMAWMGGRVSQWGARRAVILGGLWSSAMLLAYSFADRLWQFYLISFSLGLTVAVSIALSASILVKEWFEDRQATVMGLVTAFTGVTGMILGLLLPQVIAAGGWQAAYRTVAGLLFCLTVIPGLLLVRSRPSSVGLVAFGAAETPPDVQAEPPQGLSLAQALRTPHFWTLLGVIVATAAVQSINQHRGSLGQTFGLSLAAVGGVMGLQSIAAVVTQLVAGVAADRLGLLRASWGCLGLQILGCLGLLLVGGQTSFALSLVVLIAGISVPTLLVPVFVLRVFGPRQFAAILGPMMAAMPGGLALGAPWWGLDFDLTGGYRAGLVTAVAVSVLSGLAITWLLRAESPKAARG